MSEVIKINASRQYEIIIGRGLLDSIGELASNALKSGRIAILTDNTVDGLYGERSVISLKNAGFDVCKYVFQAGEKSKNITTVAAFLDFMAENMLTRQDAVLALGGGVTGDMAGFAAAIYLRGIEFIQVPTSLLAAVDSSVGGKTGVDIAAGKNLVGAFWQPTLVVCDTELFETLTSDILLDGISESLKMGATLDEAHFKNVADDTQNERLTAIVKRSVQLKAQIVEADERETGVRKLLNFGHTMGHAIEKYYNYDMSHGKAVAVGMAMITKASEARGLTKKGTYGRLIAALEGRGLPTACGAPTEALCKYALADKKAAGGNISLIILEEIGKGIIYDIPTEKLSEFLNGC